MFKQAKLSNKNDIIIVPYMRGRGQPACPRVQKKYEEEVRIVMIM
jgi:hypothetical protein